MRQFKEIYELWVNWMKLIVYVLVCCFFTLQLKADVDFVVWRQNDSAPAVIIPKKDYETSEQAFSRYMGYLKRNQKIVELVSENLADQGLISDFKVESHSRVLTAVNANLLLDMFAQGERIKRNTKLLSDIGADVYVIALGAEVGLSKKEAQEFQQKIAKTFDLMISLGGRDIDPALYAEAKRRSAGVNYLTDRLELDRVQAFKNQNRGLFFGICRGHQIGAVADGHTLYQDLTEDLVSDTNKHVNVSGVTSTEQQTWHKIYVMNSLLYRFLKKESYLEVNSIHHQAVKINSAADSFVVARSEGDLIVEGLQAYNNKSLSVQFHAEFPNEISQNKSFSDKGRMLIKGVVAYARLIRQKRLSSALGQCKSLFL